LRHIAAADLGVNTDNVLMARIDPNQSGYTSEETETFFQMLHSRLRETSGVKAVGSTFLPLLEGDFYREGDELATPQDPGERTDTMAVSRDFFAAAGIPIVRGRGFGSQDTENSSRVAVISETAARYYFPDEDPLGKPAPIVKTAGEIVGVVRDAKLRDVHEVPGSVVYMSSEQRGELSIQQTLYIRTEGDAASFAPILRQIVRELDDSLPVYDLKTLAAQKDGALVRERLTATLSGFFAVLSLLLAAIGIYGVVAYSVVSRTREIGVRMSLGAERSDILWMIQRNALALTAAGIAIGIPLSLALYRLLENQLFGVEPNDTLTLASTAAILAAVAVAAAWIPARRASSIEPATVLRCD
jgi:predicted permease